MVMAVRLVLALCFVCSSAIFACASSPSRRMERSTQDDVVGKVHSAQGVLDEKADAPRHVLRDILSAENMTAWWRPHALYTYDALAAAATDFFDGAFLPLDEPQRRKREFAAFISHVVAETKLQVIEAAPPVVTVDGEENKHCDRTYAACASGKSYHGRGPLLMAGNANYAQCSELLGLGSLLVIDPDRVARDAKIAWGSALCVWLRDDGLGSAQAHAMRDEQLGGGFGASTAVLKGQVECGPRPLKKDADDARVAIYHATCKLLGLPPDHNVRCSPQRRTVEPSDSASAIEKLMSKDKYATLFPQAADLYAYDAFRQAASLHPTFAASENEAFNARELAAFLAQAAAATERFTLRAAHHADEYDEGVFCDTPLASCLEGRKYHGRGPFMTARSSNYAQLSQAIGVDVLRNPEMMAKDTAVAWKAALHVWMTDSGRGRPHDFVSRPELLAQSSNILFGSLVCGSSPRDERGDATRVRIYKEVMTAIDARIPSEPALSCKTVAFDEDEELPPMARYLTDADFALLFPQASPHFSYRTLVEAAKHFPRFAGEPDEDSNRLEVAAFVAHAAVGSRNFSTREVDNAAFYLPDDFCDRNVTDCVRGKRYHGRGPFAIAWNYNYRKCGDAIGVDLVRHPEYVYLDSLVMWKAALWQWMEHRPLPSYSSLHAVVHRHFTTREDNFRTSSILVGGAIACGSDDELRRVELFAAIARHLQLKPMNPTLLRCKLTDDSKPSQVASLLSAADFYDLTNAGAGAPLYDYRSFLAAASLFPAFAGASEHSTNRREIAAFFAHAAAHTANFRETEDRAAAARCSAPPCYHKRGPFMIEGDAMYSKLRRALDKNVMQDPGLVARDSDTAWQSALLVWMSDGGNGSAHEFVRISDFGFAASLRVLQPSLCASNSSSARQAVQDRVRRYTALCSVLGVAPELTLSCLDPAFQLDSTSTVAAASSPRGLASILSKELFVDLFPDADPLYTYNALLDAAAKFPAFANDGPDRQNRQEVAAFVAQMAHAAGNFTFTQQTGWNLFAPSEYCDSAGASNYSCNPSKRYHGRGPIQLTWNYNYAAYGNTIGVDLLNNPEWVATDSKVAWGSAIWYWMLDQGGGRGSIHDVFVRGTAAGGDYDFARTTWLLNGGLECGTRPVAPEPQPQRIRFFRRYAARFHVEPGTKLSCHSGDYEPQKA